MSDHAGILLFFLSATLLAGSTFLRKRDRDAGLPMDEERGTISLTAAAEKGASLAWTELLTRIVVTALVLGCSLYMILSNHYSSEQEKWAYGVVGIVLGYWLKG